MRKKLLSIILSLAVLIQFAGCSNSNEKEEITTEITTELEIDEFTEEDLLVLLNEIASVEVNYNYEEYYDFDYEDILRVANTYQECDNDLGDFDYSDLSSKILNNSGIKLTYDSKTDQVRYGKNDKENEVAEALWSAVYSLNNAFTKEDYCKLSNLKIKVVKINEDEIVALYDNEADLITIDYDAVVEAYEYDYKNYKENLEDEEEDIFVKFDEFLSTVIRHELNHARQYICNCREAKGQENINVCYNQELYGNSLIEASAESEIYNDYVNVYRLKNYKENNILTYSEERKTQSYILLLGLLQKDFSLNEYYKAIFNGDLNSFLNIYGLDSKEKIENFYQIYYALNTKNCRTKLAQDLIDNEIAETQADLNDALGIDYKIGIFKMTISDLIHKAFKENMELSECLTLYNYIKSLVTYLEGDFIELEDGNNIWCFDESFLNGIGTIDSLFYEFITNYYDKSLEDVKYKEKEIRIFVDYLFLDADWADSYEKRNFLDKYPVISEIGFSNDAMASFIISFDNAYENGYTRERYLKLGE